MFDNNRYMTSGIQQEIPVELQAFMWGCIDDLRKQGRELDYLQVFELDRERSVDVFFQKIIHRQEVPNYEKTYYMFSEETVKEKVFVIDSGEYSTMLLSSDY